MDDQPIRQIGAAVLRRPDGKVLLLKRAPTHSSNPNKWCFVTGYVEPGETPRDTAIRELGEELGIEALPVRAGEVVIVQTGGGRTLHVFPFLFEVGEISIHLEQEHVDYAWIEPQELYAYEFVQQLDEDLMALGLL